MSNVHGDLWMYECACSGVNYVESKTMVLSTEHGERVFIGLLSLNKYHKGHLNTFSEYSRLLVSYPLPSMQRDP